MAPASFFLFFNLSGAGRGFLDALNSQLFINPFPCLGVRIEQLRHPPIRVVICKHSKGGAGGLKRNGAAFRLCVVVSQRRTYLRVIITLVCLYSLAHQHLVLSQGARGRVVSCLICDSIILRNGTSINLRRHGRVHVVCLHCDCSAGKFRNLFCQSVIRIQFPAGHVDGEVGAHQLADDYALFFFLSLKAGVICSKLCHCYQPFLSLLST